MSVKNLKTAENPTWRNFPLHFVSSIEVIPPPPRLDKPTQYLIIEIYSNNYIFQHFRNIKTELFGSTFQELFKF